MNPNAATAAAPKTAADARKLIAELTAKRAGLEAVIASTAEWRKGHAVAAEFGDAAAQDTLRQIEAEDAQARIALQNLDVVIDQMSTLREKLSLVAAEQREREREQERSDAIDELLKIDDEIDDVLDHARQLLEKRAEMGRYPILANQRSNCSLVAVTDEIGRSLLGYFDKWLPQTARAGASYAEIIRVAEWDGNNCGRISPRMAARPPRELSIIEKNMRRATCRPYYSSISPDAESDKRKADAVANPPAVQRHRAIDSRAFERRIISG